MAVEVTERHIKMCTCCSETCDLPEADLYHQLSKDTEADKFRYGQVVILCSAVLRQWCTKFLRIFWAMKFFLTRQVVDRHIGRMRSLHFLRNLVIGISEVG